jgi:hypothetical protein
MITSLTPISSNIINFHRPFSPLTDPLSQILLLHPFQLFLLMPLCSSSNNRSLPVTLIDSLSRHLSSSLLSLTTTQLDIKPKRPYPAELPRPPLLLSHRTTDYPHPPPAMHRRSFPPHIPLIPIRTRQTRERRPRKLRRRALQQRTVNPGRIRP